VTSSVRSLAFPTLLFSLLAVSTIPATSAERAGAQSYKEAEKLNLQAMQLAQQGHTKEAETLFKRELAILEKVKGPDSADYSTVLNNLAELYTRQGRYAEAEALARRSLAIREKVLGANSPETAVTVNNLANIFQVKGQSAEAEPLYKRAVAITEKARGAAHPDVAAMLNNLGELYNAMGRLAEAEPIFKRALAIRQKALRADDPALAESYTNLAGLYATQSRYGEAERLFKQSLEILQKAFGIAHPYVASNLTALAVVYEKQGRYAEVEPLLKTALAIREKVLAPDHPDVADALASLANFCVGQNRHSEAEAHYKRALAIQEKALGPDHASVALTLLGLGNVYRLQGRSADAQAFYERALTVSVKALGPNHPQVAAILNQAAQLYAEQRLYAEAEPLYRQSLAIWEKAVAPDHPAIAENLQNLAQIYSSEGRYAEAEPLFWRALTIEEKVHGHEHPAVAICLNNLGLLYDREGRFAEAQPFYRRSLVINEKALGPEHPLVITTLDNLIKLFADGGRFDAALPFVRRALGRNIARPYGAFPSLMGAAQQGLISPEQSFEESYGVMQEASSSAAAEAVQKLAQRFAAGSGRLAELVRADQDLASEGKQLDDALMTEALKSPGERNAGRESQIRKRIAEVEAEQKASSDTLAREFPGYVALSKPAPLSLDETRALLSDDEAVVAFHVTEKKGYAWVITSASAYWTPLPSPSAELIGEVKKLRQMVTDDADKPFDAALAYHLYQQTFAPLESWIKDKKRISVFANGALTSIPFGMLVKRDPAGKSLRDIDWMIKSHAIAVLPSIYSLKTMRFAAATRSAPRSMIGFGDPVFSTGAQARVRQAEAQERPQRLAMRSITTFAKGTEIDTRSLREYLPQLPATRDEVQTIGKVLGADPADLVLGLDATETRVKQSRLDQYRIV
jgi:tetratricopeptide (TPR) repeat protein